MKSLNKSSRPSKHGVFYYCPYCNQYILEKNIGSGITCPYCEKWISSTDVFIDWNDPIFMKSIRQSIIEYMSSGKTDMLIEFLPKESLIIEIMRKFEGLSNENLSELFEKAEYMVRKNYNDYSIERMLALMIKMLYDSEKLNEFGESN
jgi:hypothetical protein